MVAIFYLGAPEPAWMPRTDVPLMVSHNRLRRRTRMPAGRGPVWIDSGVFGDLVIAGRAPDPPAVYAAALDRYRDEIGTVAYASPQDSMCEAAALARTGLTVADHQRLTVANLLELRQFTDVPVVGS